MLILTPLKIKTVTLDGQEVNKVANGDSYFTFKEQLVDEFDNPIKVADLDISWLLDDDKAEDGH
ncbi:hypothetical protein [Arsenophonus endosymbiont of Bemisia tabaci]|uniref:hypothetical protein n=1 Tax=Arsenophonus endosymbiont of Bemisia tabaci TaxID=536059 RepID=UPI0015F5602C|nr:hypothetical protein [Arsenophonus endosymbiont of Bemisia tabaci]CAA2931329.1 hypothetical protein ARSQ2_02482 [Arsenophonus endosymbiont of Bemisia tabaci Q2]